MASTLQALVDFFATGRETRCRTFETKLRTQNIVGFVSWKPVVAELFEQFLVLRWGEHESETLDLRAGRWRCFWCELFSLVGNRLGVELTYSIRKHSPNQAEEAQLSVSSAALDQRRSWIFLFSDDAAQTRFHAAVESRLRAIETLRQLLSQIQPAEQRANDSLLCLQLRQFRATIAAGALPPVDADWCAQFVDGSLQRREIGFGATSRVFAVDYPSTRRSQPSHSPAASVVHASSTPAIESIPSALSQSTPTLLSESTPSEPTDLIPTVSIESTPITSIESTLSEPTDIPTASIESTATVSIESTLSEPTDPIPTASIESTPATLTDTSITLSESSLSVVATPVAVKKIVDLTALASARLEATIQSRLSCKYVLPLIAVHDQGEELLIVTPLCLGSASDALRAIGRPPCAALLVYWLSTAAQGLWFLHSRGIIHRDLKGSNFLVDRRTLALMLCDLGASRTVGQQMTLHGVGTYQYTAPEILAAQPYRLSADVYSFGVFLAELLTATPPFSDTPMLPILGIIDGSARPLVNAAAVERTVAALSPAVDCHRLVASLDALMRRCWHHDPLSRPSALAICLLLFSTIRSCFSSVLLAQQLDDQPDFRLICQRLSS